MIHFIKHQDKGYYAIHTRTAPSARQTGLLEWLLGDGWVEQGIVEGDFLGPLPLWTSPFETGVLQIFSNCGLDGIDRLEYYRRVEEACEPDPLVEQIYHDLGQGLFPEPGSREPIRGVEDLRGYCGRESLALSEHEIRYLEKLSEKEGRSFFDTEVYGFAQINSEHCRHKVFVGKPEAAGNVRSRSLMDRIRETVPGRPSRVVSAFTDNVAFLRGPRVHHFAPTRRGGRWIYDRSVLHSLISLKAETHNFPTTVQAFHGAGTGVGGEIRDRMAGGTASVPLAGSAVYMTSYPRLEAGRPWEAGIKPRPWRYQDPARILVEASDGASDYGNKFGQPLIVGSILTLEIGGEAGACAYDKVVMLAGGVGIGNAEGATKKNLKEGDRLLLLGGDNYRIGMGGGAISSLETGGKAAGVEFSAVQRSNPEMQKRVMNTVRALFELRPNPIASIHDHGAGGHLNCFAELLGSHGGRVQCALLPVGDPSLAPFELLCNESQERMGLVVSRESVNIVADIASRERCPCYEVGIVGSDGRLVFEDADGAAVFDLSIKDLFPTPQPIKRGFKTRNELPQPAAQPPAGVNSLQDDLAMVVKLESVACKDWLTNKVDRSVSGRVAMQQTLGEIQLPLSNLGIVKAGYFCKSGIAMTIGHAPLAMMVSPGKGACLALAEALTNMVLAPLTHGISGVSVSANWMWPSGGGEDYLELEAAVKHLCRMAIELGVSIPTGKDSLSMVQKYSNQQVRAPETLIISAAAEVEDVARSVGPALEVGERAGSDSRILYVDFCGDSFHLGGSSLLQTRGYPGKRIPGIKTGVLKNGFQAVQKLIAEDLVLSGHDVSAGGLLVSLLEMNFPNTSGGMDLRLDDFGEAAERVLFSEKPGVVLQVFDLGRAESILSDLGATYRVLGKPSQGRKLRIRRGGQQLLSLDIDTWRDRWMRTSALLDERQVGKSFALQRFENYSRQPLAFKFPSGFDGRFDVEARRDLVGPKPVVKAAVVRECGTNGEREMALGLWMAGFEVIDVPMADLADGKVNFDGVDMLAFAGGFSNSDYLGSSRGWAGAFKYNARASLALKEFYQREDTLSYGVCNGCQLMVILDVGGLSGGGSATMGINACGKFQSHFLAVDIEANDTVMFGSLSDCTLGVWAVHGEGRFLLSSDKPASSIPVRYHYDSFPGNPNGSDFQAAALATSDGRHVAMMPHIDRSLFPWNWAHYPAGKGHEVSPWILPFLNAYDWLARWK